MEIGYGKLAQSGAKPLQDFFDSIRLSCSPMSQVIQNDSTGSHSFEQGPAFFKSGSYKHLCELPRVSVQLSNSSGSIQSNFILFKRLDIAYNLSSM
jgi:hypothetical protein